MSLHPSHKKSMRTAAIALAILAVIALLARILPALPGARGIANYLPLHMLLETFAVVVAMLIFAVGWHAQNRNLPGNIVLLACAFFGVGLLDFAHILSYAGMPDFVTPSSAEKGIDFWLAARSMAALALLAVVVMPWRPFASATTRYALLSATLAATALAYWIILFHQDKLPHTFLPGKGLTAFKIASEYLLIALNLAAALILWQRMSKPLAFNATALFGALCTMALSEFLFTLYTDLTDIYNLLGHIYKGVSYLFLYRAVFVSTVEAPYHQLQSSEIRLHTLYDSTSDAVMLLDGKGFFDCNKASLALFGCANKEEFCSMHPADLSPPEQPCGTDSKMLAERQIATAMEQGNNQFEWMHKRADTGKTFAADVLLNRMELDGKTVFQATVRDITVRNKAEELLRRSEAKLRALYDSTGDAVMLVGEKGFLDCNRATLELFGCATVEEFCTKHPGDISPPKQPCGGDSWMLAEQNNAAALEKGSNHFEWVCRRTDTGRAFPVEVLLNRMELDGKTILQATVRDITARKQVEDALQESEAMLIRAQEIAHIGHFKFNPFAGVVSGSDELFRIFGLSREEFNFSDFVNSVHPDDRAFDVATIESSIKQKTGYEIEHRLLLRDGTIKWVKVIGEFADAVPEEQSLLIGTVQDITARRLGDEELKKAQSSLVAAQRLAKIGSWKWDVLNNTAIWSDETYRLFEIDKNDLSEHRKNFLDLITPDDRIKVDQALSDALNGVKKYDIEYRICLAGGKEKVIHALAEVVRDTEGKAIAMQGTVQDITERKETENALMLKNLVFDASIAANTIADLNGIITEANEMFLKIWGYQSRGEVIGKPLPHFLDNPDVAVGIVAALDKTGQWEGEYTARKKNGETFHAYGLATVVKDKNGEKIGYQSAVLDITERKQTEDALNQFKYTLDQTLDSIFMFRESDFRFIYVNEGAMRQVGYTHDELLEMMPLDIKPEFTPARFQEMVQLLKDATRPSLTFETIHRHKDGHDVPVEIFLQLVRKAKSEPLFMAIVRDITERKQAEDTQRKLYQVVEQSPSSIVITDADTNIEYVNRAFVEETGYSLAEAMGKNPRLLNSGKNPEEIFQEMWSCLKRGEAWRGELINRRKDGSEYVEHAVISAMRLADGSVTNYLAIKENITARKADEAKIERLSRTYHLLSRVNEAIVRAPNRSLLFEAVCNAAMASELFRFVWIGMLYKKEQRVIPMARSGAEQGYTSAFNIRLDDERYREWPIVKAIREGVHVVRQDIGNETDSAAWQNETAKRGYRSAGMFPIREMGVVVGTINVYSADEHFFTRDIVELMLEFAADVSFALDVFAEKNRRGQVEDEIRQLNIHLERRVAERTHQLELVNKELEAFCYSVSHDLRAPLRSIDGFSQVLLKKYQGQLDATGKDYLDRVRRSSQHMGHLIDDMLQLSQVTRGPLKRDRVDLSAIAEQVVEELRKAHPERQVRFILQQGMAVHGDAGLLHIVMVNLLGNAWKYSGKKAAAEIEFGMQDRSSDHGAERVFFVRDNGAGFNMDYAQKLFGAFQRLHGASEFEGTGIGLATVQRIVHRHHGKVWAEGKEGQGATFYFTLPQRERESKGAA